MFKVSLTCDMTNNPIHPQNLLSNIALGRLGGWLISKPYANRRAYVYHQPARWFGSAGQGGFILLLFLKKKSALACMIPLMCFRFLDKAAILEDKQSSSNEKQQSPWKLATVTKVEEMKLILNMIPVWLTTLPFGICLAQTSTFFIKQGTM